MSYTLHSIARSGWLIELSSDLTVFWWKSELNISNLSCRQTDGFCSSESSTLHDNTVRKILFLWRVIRMSSSQEALSAFHKSVLMAFDAARFCCDTQLVNRASRREPRELSWTITGRHCDGQGGKNWRRERGLFECAAVTHTSPRCARKRNWKIISRFGWRRLF